MRAAAVHSYTNHLRQVLAQTEKAQKKWQIASIGLNVLHMGELTICAGPMESKKENDPKMGKICY